MLPTIVAFLQGQEWLLLVLVVVLLFGAAKVPELARSLGKAKSEFRKASAEGEREAAAVTAAPAEDDEKVRKAARDLGIPTEGRALSDIKADIQRKLGA